MKKQSTNAAVQKSRSLTVLIRYYVKKAGVYNGVSYQAGSVVLLVETSDGKRHYVTLRRNHCHSCDCEAYTLGNGRRACWHVKTARDLENTRAAREHATRQAEQDAAKLAQALQPAATLPVLAVPVDLGARGSLNGNTGFSLSRR